MPSSWVSGADGSEFPIQNLPFGIFSHAAGGRDPRAGVAIGDSVVDLRALADAGLLDGMPFDAPSVFAGDTLNAFMARSRADWTALRAKLTALLATPEPAQKKAKLDGGEALDDDAALRDSAELQALCLVALAEVHMHLPASVGDYTDFYSSREHASNVGEMFRGKGNELQANWLHLPVGYHGRASSVVPSGTPIVRPKGQLQLDKTDATKGTEHAPCRLLDFELEMGFFVGGLAPPLGKPLTMEEAEEHIFGFVLCNDWSARDVQKFEYVPLGPFGAKNFATSISPWVVTIDALEPFRCATSAGTQAPTPLPYLQDPSYSSFDVALTVEIAPGAAPASPTVVSQSNYKHMYWTCKQQLVHHAVTGCDMRPGDLLASGTISGDAPHKFGSMLELCWQGTKEVGPLSDGTIRKFLKDGDVVTMKGTCTNGEFTVGFGACVGQVLPAGSVAPPPTAPCAPCALQRVSLHSYWRSSCSWRVRAALAFYGVPYTSHAVSLLDGAQAGVSEMAQVPKLEWADAAGERQLLTQSLSIIALLSHACDAPGKPSLLPTAPLARARASEIAEIINSGTQPLQNLSVIKSVKQAEGGDGTTLDGRAFGKAAIEKGLAAVEARVAANRDGRFCVGSHLTVADLCLVPQLYNARRFDVDLGAYPRCVAVEAHLATLPPFVAAHPDAQPDAAKK